VSKKKKRQQMQTSTHLDFEGRISLSHKFASPVDTHTFAKKKKNEKKRKRLREKKICTSEYSYVGHAPYPPPFTYALNLLKATWRSKILFNFSTFQFIIERPPRYECVCCCCCGCCCDIYSNIIEFAKVRVCVCICV
jgi:hypothetical protein